MRYYSKLDLLEIGGILRLSGLEQNDYITIQRYLAAREIIAQDEKVTRMQIQHRTNGTIVVSVDTKYHAFALKQIGHEGSAGNALAASESAFYKTVNAYPYLSRFMPVLYHHDGENGILIFDAIDDPTSWVTIYRTHHITDDEAEFLSRWLSHLHRLPVTSELRTRLNERSPWSQLETKVSGLKNTEQMASLRANDLTEYDRLITTIEQVCNEITKPDNILLHGGFWPENWINTDSGIYIIDPKYCYVGRAEIDLALFVAHLKLAAVPRSRQENVFQYYQNRSINYELVHRMAGVEMMWRLTADVPPPGIGAKARTALLREAKELILN